MAINASKPTGVSSGKSADAQITTTAGHVYWVGATAGATGGLFHLRDGTADSATSLFSVSMPANSVAYFGPFDPPIPFATAIRLDAPGTNLLVNVCYG